MAHGARNDWVASRHDQEAGHGAVEEHVHEEFVVVETDTVSNPWAMMVHLEDAAVALGAMMASVRLCLVAPLADTYATVAFALDRWLHAHKGLILLRNTRVSSLLCGLACGGNQWSFGRLEVL